MHTVRYFSRIVLFLMAVSLVALGSVCAKDMGGWEEEGAYNELYQPTELDRLKCTVVNVTEVTPMKGMSPGIALVVEDHEGEKITVHVGPKWFLGDSVAIRKGEKLKIRGSWADVEGQEVFMASKIKKGDYYELKVRLTKTGKPFWTMSEEELAREQAAQ